MDSNPLNDSESQDLSDTARSTILTFAGQIASGKSTLSRAVSEHLGWRRVTFVELIREGLLSKGIDNPTRRDLQEYGQKWIKEDIVGFANALLNKVGWEPGDSLIVEAIRHEEMLKVLRNLTCPSSVYLVFVAAPFEVRRSRLLNRGVLEGLADFESHDAERESQTNLQIVANLVVDTQSSVQDCVKEIANWLECERISKKHLSPSD